jgi:hypothetical protein
MGVNYEFSQKQYLQTPACAALSAYWISLMRASNGEAPLDRKDRLVDFAETGLASWYQSKHEAACYKTKNAFDERDIRQAFQPLLLPMELKPWGITTHKALSSKVRLELFGAYAERFGTHGMLFSFSYITGFAKFMKQRPQRHTIGFWGTPQNAFLFDPDNVEVSSEKGLGSVLNTLLNRYYIECEFLDCSYMHVRETKSPSIPSKKLREPLKKKV